MVMKQQIIDAFALIGVSPDAPEPEASKAYKQLALRHHPDKNQGSTEATERFQQLGEAWHICQKHYEFPHLSHENVVPNHQAFQQRSWDPTEDVPLDPEEAAAFFDFLFKATMQGRYSFGSGQRYRRQRAGGYGGGVHMFSGGFAESQARQKDNELRQKREKMEYEQRVREFEAEIAAEVKAAKAAELEAKKNAQRLTDALRTAFTAARAGKGQEMQAIFTRHDLPVMFPERVAKGTIIYQQSNPLLKGTKLPDRYDTILHAAASRCDVASVVFLLKRGADASFRNSSDITALHSAILTGNVPVISHFLSLHPRIEGCHPSKAAGVPSRTPLEMAIHSGDGACVDLMVKFATVHDVQKQWELLCQDDRHNLKSILEKKKAFSPANDGLTVKQRRKLEEEQAKAKKEQLLREERQRAEANRQRKESNKAKLEQQKEQERLKQLEEEVKRQEQERKRVEEEQRRNEEKRKKREEQRQRREADARRDEEERQRKEADLARQRLEAQQKKQREQEDLQRRRKEAEERRLAEAAREEARRKEEAERRKLKEEAEKRRAEERRLALEEKRRAEEAERKRIAEEKKEKEKEERARQAWLRQDELEKAKAAAEQTRKAEQARINRERLEAQAAEMARVAQRRAEEQSRPTPPSVAPETARPQKICRSFRKGYCRFGTKCRDSHVLNSEPSIPVRQQTVAPPAPKPAPAEPLPSPSPEPIRRPCRFFARGGCKFGQRCRDLHVAPVDENQTAKPKGPSAAYLPSPAPSPTTFTRHPAPPPIPRHSRPVQEDIQTVEPATDELFPREHVRPARRPKAPKKSLTEQLAEKDRELQRLNELVAKMQAGP